MTTEPQDLHDAIKLGMKQAKVIGVTTLMVALLKEMKDKRKSNLTVSEIDEIGLKVKSNL